MNRSCAFLLSLLILGIAWFDRACAQSASKTSRDAALSKAVNAVRNDIEAAKKGLMTTRERITKEKLKKVEELTRLEDEVSRLREQQRKHSLGTGAGSSRFRELNQEAERLEQFLDGARSTLLEARRNAETHFSLVDSRELKEDLDRADRLLDRADDATSPETCSRAVLGLLLTHIRACSRIRRTQGSAIDKVGKEQNGVFIQIGGVAAAFAGDGKTGSCGLVRMQHASPHPHVWPLPEEDGRKAVRRLADGKTATVPLDISGGAALRSLRAERTLAEELRAGGPVMIPILALALICVAVGLWKCCSLWRIPVPSDTRVAPFARSLFASREEAGAMVAKARGPLRRLLAEAVAHADEPRDQLEEVLHEAILAEVPGLESKLSVLSVGAAIAPLLGLLGTVTGMIHTFRLISVFGTGDSRMLSGGISEALVTTEAGLVVAIPLLLLHAVLARRVRTIADGLEQGALRILNECPTSVSQTEDVP